MNLKINMPPLLENSEESQALESGLRPSEKPAAKMELKAEDLERFWKSVDKKGPSDCWNWLAGRVSGGYGRFHFNFNGKTRHSAHRLSYAMHNAVDMQDLFVCHRCDNPSCVNPDHLFLGTCLDNVRDMIAKGRKRFGKPADYKHLPRGSRHGSAKLSEQQVLEIRRVYPKEGSTSELGERFGVSPAMIQLIINRKNWTHI